MLREALSSLELEVRDAADTTLADIYDSDKFKGKVDVIYEYDHGDSWEHQIAFLGRADPVLRKAMMIPDDMEVVCLGGEVCVLFCAFLFLFPISPSPKTGSGQLRDHY